MIAGMGFMAMSVLFVSCDNDDDDDPELVDEEEVITTMNVTLVGGGETITLQSRDLDGDGPNAPELSVSGSLAAGTTYAGSIELLNETESPVEDITEEIEEEDDEHQFFFTTSGAIASVDYADEDGDGNPLGLSFSLQTGDAGSGSLLITYAMNRKNRMMVPWPMRAGKRTLPKVLP